VKDERKGRTESDATPADAEPSRNAEVRTPASRGQAKRGTEGADAAGASELATREAELGGGLTAGPAGEPTIDIHGGDRSMDSGRLPGPPDDPAER
jgi:hypothetical protein